MIFRDSKDFNKDVKTFLHQFTPDNEYIIYGAGHNLDCLLGSIGNELKIKYIVDNNKNLQGKTINNIPIKSPDVLLEEDKNNAKIIITPYTEMHREIADNLEEIGFDSSTYCHSYDISTVWNYYHKSKIILPEVAFFITTSCPLNCQGCIVYVPYHENKGKDVSFEAIKKDIDCMFSICDYVYHICLAGGEPLMHKNLAKIIKYIHDNYKGRYTQIRFNTSATVMPKQELLNIMSETKCYISISDYGEECRKMQKEDHLIKLLKENDISYRAQSQFGLAEVDSGVWSNFGSPLTQRNRSSEKNTYLYTNCIDNCKWIHNQNLYGCPNITGAIAGGIYTADDSEYVNLSDNFDKLDVIKMFLGYTEQGHYTFCDRCDGYGDKINKNYIAAGTQAKKRMS